MNTTRQTTENRTANGTQSPTISRLKTGEKMVHIESQIVIVEEEDEGCQSYILKPSDLRPIWSSFKVKMKMFDFLQNYFKPRTSYEPERIEYNALNILAEYQVYNLEFCKNDLNLSEVQTAYVLHLFWCLLEFDPDAEDSNVLESALQINEHKDSLAGSGKGQEIKYLGDNVPDTEEAQFAMLLKHKFILLKDMILKATERTDAACVTIVQARKMAQYAHQTYFRHLRLYDFVLKNTKSSENKHIIVPIAEPTCGKPLDQAQALADKVTQLWYEPDEEPAPTRESAMSMNDRQQSKHDPIKENTAEHDSACTVEEQSSATDADMDETLAKAPVDRRTKKVIHRNTRDWHDKIETQLNNEEDLQRLTETSGLGSKKKK